MNKILIIKPSSLGDIIHTLPMALALKKKFPDAKISWIVARGFHSLLEENPVIDELIIFERQRWGKNWKRGLASLGEITKFFLQIHQHKFDIVLDFQGLFRSGVMSWASQSPMRIGFANAREFASFSYTHRISPPPADIHAIDRYKLLLQPLGISEVPVKFPLGLPPIPHYIISNLDASSPLVVMVPGARWLTKRWPAEYFAQTSDLLANKLQAQIVLVGAAGDSVLAQNIVSLASYPKQIRDLTGKTSLRELAAVLSKADIVLSNDSGPMHLAVAVETPTLGIFGPTAPEKTGPYGKMHHTVKQSVCDPRCKRKCYNNLECMYSITPEMIAEKMVEMWNSL